MRFLFGVIVGIILTLLFLSLGGSKFLREMGHKASRLGEKIERYERLLKEDHPSRR
jgi:hypothetical protein